MRRRVSKRKQEFEKAFPNAMDLLVVCVEAGMGFDAAIARVSLEMDLTSPMLAREFKILSLELKTGKPRNECMGNLAKRICLPDVDNLVNLLVQAEKFGTGIAHPLRIHAEEMREKRYNRMEELAAKLPVKLSFPLVLFIFPAMMIALIGPAIIQVYRLFILE
jgi:tight adherence protein C